jgi:hypothetical protein
MTVSREEFMEIRASCDAQIKELEKYRLLLGYEKDLAMDVCMVEGIQDMTALQDALARHDIDQKVYDQWIAGIEGTHKVVTALWKKLQRLLPQLEKNPAGVVMKVIGLLDDLEVAIGKFRDANAFLTKTKAQEELAGKLIREVKEIDREVKRLRDNDEIKDALREITAGGEEPPDWDELKSDFDASIQIWCGIANDAVSSFGTLMNGAEEQKQDDGKLIKMLAKALSIQFPPAAPIIGFAENFVKPTVELLSKSSTGVDTRTFSGLLLAWYKLFETIPQKSNVKFFENSVKAQLIKSYGNELTHGIAKAEIKRLPYMLPTPPTIRKMLMEIWIYSTPDNRNLLTDWHDDAGFIQLAIQHPAAKIWKFFSCHIDDCQKPAQTIETMKLIYGKSTLLEDLPFEMKISINGRKLAIGFKGKNGPLTFKEGSEPLWDKWIKIGKHPTIQDLRPE